MTSVFTFTTRAGVYAAEMTSITAPRPPSVQEFFKNLNKDNLQLVPEFYAEEIVFEDPLGRIDGVLDLRDYYKNLYQGVKSIQFEFSKELRQGNQYAGFWTMTLEAEGLNGGKPVRVTGMSQIEFNSAGKAVYHRDYFDMGAFIYEHVPVLKIAIRFIKKKLAHTPHAMRQ